MKRNVVIVGSKQDVRPYNGVICWEQSGSCQWLNSLVAGIEAIRDDPRTRNLLRENPIICAFSLKLKTANCKLLKTIQKQEVEIRKPTIPKYFLKLSN